MKATGIARTLMNGMPGKAPIYLPLAVLLNQSRKLAIADRLC